jgi:hypothetical protein
MNLTILFAVLEAVPELVTDVESAIDEIKADAALSTKIGAVIAGIEKLYSDLLPALKSL